MAEERTERLLPIPCNPWESERVEAIQATGRPLLVSCAGTAQPKAAHLGETGADLRLLATRTENCSCISRCSLRRQTRNGVTSKVRTVCGSAASTGLCGGWSETAIPTATVFILAVCDLRAPLRDRRGPVSVAASPILSHLL